MGTSSEVRACVLGRERPVSVEGGFVAVGLFVVSLVYGLLSHFLSWPAIEPVQYLFVVVGTGFAVLYSYRNSGLAVSLALAVAPVAGTLTFYAWLTAQQQAIPVALPLSFSGHGAVAFWLPTALFLGILGFGLGVLARRTKRAVAVA